MATTVPQVNIDFLNNIPHEIRTIDDALNLIIKIMEEVENTTHSGETKKQLVLVILNDYIDNNQVPENAQIFATIRIMAPTLIDQFCYLTKNKINVNQVKKWTAFVKSVQGCFSCFSAWKYYGNGSGASKSKGDAYSV